MRTVLVRKVLTREMRRGSDVGKQTSDNKGKSDGRVKMQGAEATRKKRQR
jgi:hypothetical protein